MNIFFSILMFVIGLFLFICSKYFKDNKMYKILTARLFFPSSNKSLKVPSIIIMVLAIYYFVQNL